MVYKSYRYRLTYMNTIIITNVICLKSGSRPVHKLNTGLVDKSILYFDARDNQAQYRFTGDWETFSAKLVSWHSTDSITAKLGCLENSNFFVGRHHPLSLAFCQFCKQLSPGSVGYCLSFETLDDLVDSGTKFSYTHVSDYSLCLHFLGTSIRIAETAKKVKFS